MQKLSFFKIFKKIFFASQLIDVEYFVMFVTYRNYILNRIYIIPLIMNISIHYSYYQYI